MSRWRSLKPVVCKVHGYAVAGGSDIALSADIVVMADDAKIGYPRSPARARRSSPAGSRR
jgi:enoyl-CoA hydratase